MRLDVYEMFKGRLVATFWVDTQDALDYARDHYLDVPDEAGLVVVESSGRKPAIEQIGDVAELVARGYRVLWRCSPKPQSYPDDTRVRHPASTGKDGNT